MSLLLNSHFSLFSYSVNLFCQRKIVLRDSARVVRGDGKFGVAPAEKDVGMMVAALGYFARAIDKFEGFGKV